MKDKGVIKRAIVTPDKHFPLHDEKAIKCLVKAIELVKPNVYIDLGDVGEWSAFSSHKWKMKKAPPLEYLIKDFKKDIKAVNNGMNIIDEALDKVNCKEKYITEGNHDNWCNMVVEKYPYIPEYKFANAVDLKGRGYIYYPFGKRLKIDKWPLRFYHGHLYGGQYHAANHIRKMKCPVMYGHWHDLQQHTDTSEEGPKSAWSIGCLKDMRAEQNAWLGRRPINWTHAFAIVDFFKNGDYKVEIVEIINGRTTLWGELIESK
jgi:hypothetical protein